MAPPPPSVHSSPSSTCIIISVSSFAFTSVLPLVSIFSLSAYFFLHLSPAVYLLLLSYLLIHVPLHLFYLLLLYFLTFLPSPFSLFLSQSPLPHYCLCIFILLVSLPSPLQTSIYSNSSYSSHFSPFSFSLNSVLPSFSPTAVFCSYTSVVCRLPLLFLPEGRVTRGRRKGREGSREKGDGGKRG